MSRDWVLTLMLKAKEQCDDDVADRNADQNGKRDGPINEGWGGDTKLVEDKRTGKNREDNGGKENLNAGVSLKRMTSLP